MKKWLSQVVLVLLLMTHSIFSVYPANAEDDLLLRVDTNQGVTSDSSQALPNFAKLKQMRFRIYQSNPDNISVQVVLDYPLKNSNDILDSKWNLGTWIYGPSLYCLNNDSCNFILIVRPNWDQKARVQIFKKATDNESTISDCPATYTVGKNENNDSIITYNLSITCLNITATFASYTFSGYDLGLKEKQWQFTTPSYVVNDYFELAKQSYDKNGGKSGLSTASPLLQKDAVIESFSKLVSSTKLSAKSLKTLVTKSKSITKSRKNSYLKTIREFENYSKISDVQIEELENKGVNFDIVAKSYVEEWTSWNKKLIDITGAVIKK
jgi:hypothetical protein